MDAGLEHEARLAALERSAPSLARAFGLDLHGVRRLPSISRAVFALDTAAGRFVLRLHPGAACPGHLESTLLWLEALVGAGFRVPRPLRTGEGALLVETRVDGPAGMQRASLLTWLPGESLAPEQLEPRHARAMGDMLARLHDCAMRWSPPPGFTRPLLDAGGLFGARSPYAADADAHFSGELQEVMAEVARRTRALMQRLDATSDARGLIHADFIVKNCLFAATGIAALDFDDCAQGYWLYDLAPATLQFSARPAAAELAVALWAGYTARRPLPASQRADLETFVAARLAASCRWLLANRHVARVRAQTPALLAQRTAELRAYLDTGRVRRRSAML